MTPDAPLNTLEEQKQTSTAGMTTKVVKGSIWTLAGQVAPLFVSLVTTPFVIRMLGAEGYGVLILVGLIPSYLSFADFGMPLASTKFAAEAYAERDSKKEARIVRSGVALILCTSIPVAFVLFAFAPQILSFFQVGDAIRPEATVALRIASITFVLNFLGNVVSAPQLTRLRLDLYTVLTIGLRIVGLVLTPFAVFVVGISGAMLVLLFVSIFTLLGHLVLFQRLNGHLFELTVEPDMVRRMIKFGSSMVLATIAAVLLVNVEKGILARTVSSRALAHYSVAFTLASMMTMFSGSMVQSLVPAFSQLQSSDSREHLSSLFSRGLRLTLIWLVPALALLVLVAEPFFAIYAGQEFGEQSILPFYILIVGIAFNALAYMPYTVILASGRSDLFAKLYWMELVFYLIGVWYLASVYGAVGAAIAWSLRVMIDAAAQLFIARRFAGVRYIHPFLFSFAASSLVMTVPVIANYFFGLAHPVVILSLVASLIVYAILILKTTLEVEEVSWIRARMKRPFVRMFS